MATREEFVKKIKEIYEAHSVYVGTGNGELVKDLTFDKVYKMEKTYARRDENGKPLWGSDTRRDFTFIGKNYELYGDEGMKNAQAVDCSGLEVSALRALKVIGEKDDFNCRSFQEACDEVELKDLQPGDLVFNARMTYDKNKDKWISKASHMATYVGDGQCCEARGRDYGTQRRPLSAGSWVVGGRLDWFDDNIPILTRNLRYIQGNLMRGEDVRMCQQQLAKKEFDPGEIDSIYGKKTEAAVIDFQRANELTPDGIVGQITWGKLFEE